jgi:hypothetical protein
MGRGGETRTPGLVVPNVVLWACQLGRAAVHPEDKASAWTGPSVAQTGTCACVRRAAMASTCSRVGAMLCASRLCFCTTGPALLPFPLPRIRTHSRRSVQPSWNALPSADPSRQRFTACAKPGWTSAARSGLIGAAPDYPPPISGQRALRLDVLVTCRLVGGVPGVFNLSARSGGMAQFSQTLAYS